VVWEGVERRRACCPESPDSCPLADKVLETHDAVFSPSDPKKGLVWIAQQNMLAINRIEASQKSFHDTFRVYSEKAFWGILTLVAASLGHFAWDLIRSHVTVR
jgi:hypothetical protein